MDVDVKTMTNLVYRFWNLRGSQRREIALKLNLINETEVSFPEGDRYALAFRRAERGDKIHQLYDAINLAEADNRTASDELGVSPTNKQQDDPEKHFSVLETTLMCEGKHREAAEKKNKELLERFIALSRLLHESERRAKQGAALEKLCCALLADVRKRPDFQGTFTCPIIQSIYEHLLREPELEATPEVPSAPPPLTGKEVAVFTGADVMKKVQEAFDSLQQTDQDYTNCELWDEIGMKVRHYLAPHFTPKT